MCQNFQISCLDLFENLDIIKLYSSLVYTYSSCIGIILLCIYLKMKFEFLFWHDFLHEQIVFDE